MTCGQDEPLGEHRGYDAHGGVGGGHAAQDQVDLGLGAGLLDRLGEHQRGGDGVGAGDRVVDDVDALVGTHLQRLAHRVDGLLGADAQRGDLDLARRSPAFSLSWRACSTAYSSSSDRSPSTPTRSTVLSSSNLRSAVASGTCLTQTMMFMVVRRLPPCHSRVTRRPARASSHRTTSQPVDVRVRRSGRISRSRIRPTTSHATAPSPQLNRAFLVSAFCARELHDAVVPGEDPEVDPRRRPRGRTSPGRCPGWRPARSAAPRRRGTARRRGRAARPPARAPPAPG